MARKSKTHQIVAIAFKEDFELQDLSQEWQTNQVLRDRKDVRAKPAVGGGTVFAYAYGTLVFVDVDPAERTYEIKTLADGLKIDPNQKVTTEEFIVEEQTSQALRIHGETLIVDKFTPERMAVVARVVSQSAALEYYEGVATQIRTIVLELSINLKNHGSVGLTPKKLYKIVGDALTMRNEIVSVLHALDRPDFVWSDSDMDFIFDDLRAMFDLKERFQALEYRLNVVQSTMETVVNTAQDSRLYRADFIIIVLIVLEVVFALLTRFHVGGW